MNFKTAAIVAASAGVLSILFGLIGGVPVLDAVLRAVFWAAFGFGGSLGVETLLRKLVPEVFESAGASPAQEEEAPQRAVDIVLEEETPAPAGFVEEADDSDEPPRRPQAVSAMPEKQVVPEEPAPQNPLPVSEAGDEMPEIGAFLDAFKPSASGTGEEEPSAAAAPDYGDYAPASPASEPYPHQEAFMDGEPQDPAALARAVQTILKRDSQGN